MNTSKKQKDKNATPLNRVLNGYTLGNEAESLSPRNSKLVSSVSKDDDETS